MRRKFFLLLCFALLMGISVPLRAADSIEGTYKHADPSEGFKGTVVVRKSGSNFTVKVDTINGERYHCSFQGTGKKSAPDVIKFSGDGYTLPIRFSASGLTIVDGEFGSLHELRSVWCGMNGSFYFNKLYKKVK